MQAATDVDLQAAADVDLGRTQACAWRCEMRCRLAPSAAATRPLFDAPLFVRAPLAYLHVELRAGEVRRGHATRQLALAMRLSVNQESLRGFRGDGAKNTWQARCYIPQPPTPTSSFCPGATRTPLVFYSDSTRMPTKNVFDIHLASGQDQMRSDRPIILPPGMWYTHEVVFCRNREPVLSSLAACCCTLLRCTTWTCMARSASAIDAHTSINSSYCINSFTYAANSLPSNGPKNSTTKHLAKGIYTVQRIRSTRSQHAVC